MVNHCPRQRSMTKRGAHSIRRSRGGNALTFDSASNTVRQYLTLMLWTQRHPARLAILFQSIPFHCVPFHSLPFPSIPFYSILFHSIPYSRIARASGGPATSARAASRSGSSRPRPTHRARRRSRFGGEMTVILCVLKRTEF